MENLICQLCKVNSNYIEYQNRGKHQILQAKQIYAEKPFFSIWGQKSINCKYIHPFEWRFNIEIQY